jgi:nitrogen fixation uncharacterized protein
MALQAAMDFIEAIPRKPELAVALAKVADYEDLQRIGASAGFVFTPNELDLAFRHRCSMRWLRHFKNAESKPAG